MEGRRGGVIRSVYLTQIASGAFVSSFCSVLRTVDFESKFRILPRYNENQSPGAIASPRVFSANYMKKPIIPTPLSANPVRCKWEMVVGVN